MSYYELEGPRVDAYKGSLIVTGIIKVQDGKVFVETPLKMRRDLGYLSDFFKVNFYNYDKGKALFHFKGNSVWDIREQNRGDLLRFVEEFSKVITNVNITHDVKVDPISDRINLIGTAVFSIFILLTLFSVGFPYLEEKQQDSNLEVTEKAITNEDYEQGIFLNTNTAPPKQVSELPKDMPPLSKRVEIKFKVDIKNGNRAYVSGTTNLPDGTKLTVSIDSKSSYRYTGNQFDVKVVGYHFKAEPFEGYVSSSLPTGLYIIDVSMYLSHQSSKVKKIIGDEGQNLRGKLIDKGFDIFTVKKAGSFFVGISKKAAAKVERKAKRDSDREADKIYKSLMRYVKIGSSNEVEKIRHHRSEGFNYKLIQQCNNKMKKYIQPFRDLRKRAKNLPLRGSDYYISLIFATSEMAGSCCLKCCDGGLDDCKKIKRDLIQAKKEKR